MRAYSVIDKKRAGKSLSAQEIDFIIQGFVKGKIPDYQISAWLMAVAIRGMTSEETTWLTQTMVKSGKTLNLSAIKGKKADKHSTGGIGDNATLVVAPLVAAAGVNMAKMSGRGLGYTGGTLDKMESISKLTVQLANRQMIYQVKKVGLVIASTTQDIVPADKKIYALRDVTATVSSLPLIASSVMSKKIAGGAPNIVLDVKVGTGAFMKDINQARALAELMVKIGNGLGRKVVAVLSDMNQPLGFAVGNSLEIKEAIAVLKGCGPKDLISLSMSLASHILMLTKVCTSIQSAKKMLRQKITSGEAIGKFSQMIKAQKGDPDIVKDPSLLPRAKYIIPLKAEKPGYLAVVNAELIGKALIELGGGRKTKEDSIDPSVGMVFRRKMGEPVKRGQTIIEIHGNSDKKIKVAKKLLNESISIGRKTINPPRLIYQVIK